MFYSAPVTGPYSGLVISEKHNYLDLDRDDLADMMDLAVKWFTRVKEEDGSVAYPSLSWDSDPGHNGDSQVVSADTK